MFRAEKHSGYSSYEKVSKTGTEVSSFFTQDFDIFSEEAKKQ